MKFWYREYNEQRLFPIADPPIVKYLCRKLGVKWRISSWIFDAIDESKIRSRRSNLLWYSIVIGKNHFTTYLQHLYWDYEKPCYDSWLEWMLIVYGIDNYIWLIRPKSTANLYYGPLSAIDCHQLSDMRDIKRKKFVVWNRTCGYSVRGDLHFSILCK